MRRRPALPPAAAADLVPTANSVRTELRDPTITIIAGINYPWTVFQGKPNYGCDFGVNVPWSFKGLDDCGSVTPESPNAVLRAKPGDS
jgi:hypothetical protein